MAEDLPMEPESCIRVTSGKYEGIWIMFKLGKNGDTVIRKPAFSETDAMEAHMVSRQGLEYEVLGITEKEACEMVQAESPTPATLPPEFSRIPKTEKFVVNKRPTEYVGCEKIYNPPLSYIDQIAEGIFSLGAEEINFLESLPLVDDAINAAVDYAVDPLATIRLFNQRALEESDPDALEESLLRAVRLERSLDQIVFSLSSEKRYNGVPEYIPAGYKDLGKNPSLNSRDEREMFLVKKDENIMLEAKKIGLKEGVALETKINQLSDLMHRYLKTFGEAGIIRKRKGDTVSDKTIMGAGEGVCRHAAIILQTLFQTAGIKSYVVKSNTHAYNLVVDEEQNRAYLVDATPSSEGEPTIIDDITDKLNIDKDLPGVLSKGYREDHLRTIIGDTILGRLYRYRPREFEEKPSYCLFVDIEKKKEKK